MIRVRAVRCQHARELGDAQLVRWLAGGLCDETLRNLWINTNLSERQGEIMHAQRGVGPDTHRLQRRHVNGASNITARVHLLLVDRQQTLQKFVRRYRVAPIRVQQSKKAPRIVASDPKLAQGLCKLRNVQVLAAVNIKQPEDCTESVFLHGQNILVFACLAQLVTHIHKIHPPGLVGVELFEERHGHLPEHAELHAQNADKIFETQADLSAVASLPEDLHQQGVLGIGDKVGVQPAVVHRKRTAELLHGSVPVFTVVDVTEDLLRLVRRNSETSNAGHEHVTGEANAVCVMAERLHEAVGEDGVLHLQKSVVLTDARLCINCHGCNNLIECQRPILALVHEQEDTLGPLCSESNVKHYLLEPGKIQLGVLRSTQILESASDQGVFHVGQSHGVTPLLQSVIEHLLLRADRSILVRDLTIRKFIRNRGRARSNPRQH
mmetsp:Transcript_37713/g.98784  ORF Transcript_37713/g.98784 Transcript_37713/m.98784 type:complete len:437 (-) Transcript_37713:1006-2316(-)